MQIQTEPSTFLKHHLNYARNCALPSKSLSDYLGHSIFFSHDTYILKMFLIYFILNFLLIGSNDTLLYKEKL